MLNKWHLLLIKRFKCYKLTLSFYSYFFNKPYTKRLKTSTKTDLEIARPLLQTMHKMHRAGVDNYITHKGRIRKLTPRECLRLMRLAMILKLLLVTETSSI